MKQFFKDQFRLASSITTGFMTVFLCLVLLGIIAAGIGAAAGEADVVTREYVSGKRESDNTLLFLRVSGAIEAAAPDGVNLFAALGSNVVYGYQVKQEILNAADDDSIKGIVIEIDSPGGTLNGSAAIADGIAEYREKTKKPVYVHISTMAASGGYWASTTANKIFIDQGGALGSIGVIMGPIKYYGDVVTEDGITAQEIDTTYLTSGEYKDTGNPYRQLAEAERQHYQGVIDNGYNHFVTQVSTNRGISEDTIRNEIKALLYDADAGVKLKLADGIASREETFTALANELNLGDDYTVEKEAVGAGLVNTLLGAIDKTPPQKVQLSVCSESLQILALSGSPSAFCR